MHIGGYDGQYSLSKRNDILGYTACFINNWQKINKKLVYLNFLYIVRIDVRHFELFVGGWNSINLNFHNLMTFLCHSIDFI